MALNDRTRNFCISWLLVQVPLACAGGGASLEQRGPDAPIAPASPASPVANGGPPGRAESTRRESISTTTASSHSEESVRARVNDLVPCYQSLADTTGGGSGPVGEMAVVWRVQPDGAVENVRFIKATAAVAQPAFESCLGEAIGRWHFRAREVAGDAPAVAIYFGNPPASEASPGMYLWRVAHTIHVK